VSYVGARWAFYHDDRRRSRPYPGFKKRNGVQRIVLGFFRKVL